MRAEQFTNQAVTLDLSVDEYLSLARSLFFLVADGTISRTDAGQRDRVAPNDVVYGLFLAEQDAARDGIRWLPRYDALGLPLTRRASFEPDIRFHSHGAVWTLAPDLLAFVNDCMGDMASRAA